MANLVADTAIAKALSSAENMRKFMTMQIGSTLPNQSVWQADTHAAECLA